jgi:hypothetical protein
VNICLVQILVWIALACVKVDIRNAFLFIRRLLQFSLALFHVIFMSQSRISSWWRFVSIVSMRSFGPFTLFTADTAHSPEWTHTLFESLLWHFLYSWYPFLKLPMLFLLLIKLFKCEKYVLICANPHNFTLIEYFLYIILSIFSQLSLCGLTNRGLLSKQPPHLEGILLVILDNRSLLKDFKLQKSLCLLLHRFESLTLFRS